MKKQLLLAALLCSSLFASAQLPGYLPVYGLMAWWPFTVNATDSTMHGHDGTMHGCTSAAGRYGVPGTAFRFNGTSDHIYVPAGSMSHDISVDITASLTISAWAKAPTYLTPVDMQIYWRGDNTPAHDPHMLYFKAGSVYIRRDVDPGGTVNEVGYTAVGLDTNYHMFTGTYDSASSIMRIYIDGILKNTAYLPGLQTYPTASMYNYIGAVDGGTNQFFRGTIDELGIWNRALSPCEVAALYLSKPKVVSGQPRHDTAMVSTAATFTVSAAAPVPTYQWQEKTATGSYTNLTNTPPYSGVFTATLTVSPVTAAMSGNLYRCVISSDSCLNVPSDSARLTVTPLVSVPGATGKTANFRMAPNPNAGEFTLVGAGSGQVSVEVIDMLGRQVLTGSAQPQAGVVNRTFRLGSEVRSGCYFIRISSGNDAEVLRMVVER